MLSQQIRKNFLEYFQKHNHTVVASSTVIPQDDPTLLFSNAGMNQFKDVFIGSGQRAYTRAATSQKCIRAGGKHNDLDNVGHTSRHLTFFEMLGNFSFGDYFKEEAIRFAWEVSTQVLEFDPQRIWPTVFESDDEAFELWQKYVPISRITRLGEKDNFWAMGETGPCGPCSELLYDRGTLFGQASSPREDKTGERFLEFWNLVFMQFNRQLDGSLLTLPKPSIDTGAGLERVISLKMGVDTVFETDLFTHLIHRIEHISSAKYDPANPKSASFRVIADHLRSLSFAIADGAQPSNVDRGYVLRKILRRAVRYGKAIGFEQPFLAKALPALLDCMGQDYPELIKNQSRICEILTLEEEGFWRTLRRGGRLLADVCSQAKQDQRPISGREAFNLKDTYGLPLDEILLLAHDEGLSVNAESFNEYERQAKEISRANHKKTHQIAKPSQFEALLDQGLNCQFLGYEQATCQSQIVALYSGENSVQILQEGQEGIVVLATTPFYAEKGGQVADTGNLDTTCGQFEVLDVQNPIGSIIIHQGRVLQGTISVGELAHARIDETRRAAIARSHSATHLLHWALTQVLGEHIQQKGSLVDADALRFDFSHHKPLTADQIKQIEQLINSKIMLATSINCYEKPYSEAQHDSKIKQFFAEKYGEWVRVVDINFSKELCGGTHVQNTCEIAQVRLTNESSIASGIRRIEALCGQAALELAQAQSGILEKACEILKCNEQGLIERVEQILQHTAAVEKSLADFKRQQLRQIALNLKARSQTIGSHKVIMEQNPTDIASLSALMEEMSDFEGLCAIACHTDQRVQLAIRVGPQAAGLGLKANTLVQELAGYIEGKGGGRPDMAQAGGKRPLGLSELFESLRAKLSDKR